MSRSPVRRATIGARLIDLVGDVSLASPARFAIIVFALLVGVFTLLFSLPVATTSGQQAPFIDALFTAVSVVCVTGLSTVDMATFWSPFGHVLVFLGDGAASVAVVDDDAAATVYVAWAGTEVGDRVGRRAAETAHNARVALEAAQEKLQGAQKRVAARVQQLPFNE